MCNLCSCRKSSLLCALPMAQLTLRIRDLKKVVKAVTQPACPDSSISLVLMCSANALGRCWCLLLATYMDTASSKQLQVLLPSLADSLGEAGLGSSEVKLEVSCSLIWRAVGRKTGCLLIHLFLQWVHLCLLSEIHLVFRYSHPFME